jgi:hypothetical protein
LVKAFLTFNSAFRIVLCQSYLHYHKPDLVKTLLPSYDPQLHFPSSLWIRRVT